LAAACRKIYCYATVAWRKRNLIRRSETRGYCGSRKGVTVAHRRTGPYATVAWRKSKITRNIQLREYHESSKDVAVNGMTKGPGYKNGTWHRDVKKLSDMKKERMTNGIKGWSTVQRSYLGKGGTLRLNLYEISGGKIGKQVAENFSRFKKNKEMDLVEG
jgi:hypothetical protein